MKKGKLSEIHTPNVQGAPGSYMGVGKKNPTALLPTMKKSKTGKPPRKMA
jgi:hypothetical protein